MYIIAGLGNPGKKYENTRHNMGFIAIDLLADAYDIKVDKLKFKSLVGEGRIAGQRVLLMKPQTYMNRSGLAVGSIARFFKIKPEEILVVHDELDIQPGQAKLKRSGSTGGHNGLKDIVKALGTQNFWRLRFGIGHPRNVNAHIPVIDYVLQRPRNEDMDKIVDAINRAIPLMPEVCGDQMEKAMMELHSAN